MAIEREIYLEILTLRDSYHSGKMSATIHRPEMKEPKSVQTPASTSSNAHYCGLCGTVSTYKITDRHQSSGKPHIYYLCRTCLEVFKSVSRT